MRLSVLILFGLSVSALAAPPSKCCQNPVPNVLKASMPTRSPAMGNSIPSPNVDLLLTYDANTNVWFGKVDWPGGKVVKVKLWPEGQLFQVEVQFGGFPANKYLADQGFTCQPFFMGVAGVILIKE